MSLPEIASRDEWHAARTGCSPTRRPSPAPATRSTPQRRLLPMVRDREGLLLRGPRRRGAACSTLFDGRRQLIVQHFMFDPSWDDGCPSCTAGADELSDGLARAPRVARHDLRRSCPGRRSPSSSATRQRAAGRSPGTRRSAATSTTTSTSRSTSRSRRSSSTSATSAELEADRGDGLADRAARSEQPGHSCFLRDGDRVFHTYSSYARGAGVDPGGSYAFLDLTAARAGRRTGRSPRAAATPSAARCPTSSADAAVVLG